jgi:hypothetical protein
MSDKTEPPRGKVPLNQFLADFRSKLTDHELREKYELSAKAFISLIKALLAKTIITPADLEKRKVMAVQRDLAKESEFLSGLYICPNCSHPHPQPFERCPACGAKPGDYMPQQEVLDPLSTSGAHFYVDDNRTERVQKRETKGPDTPGSRKPGGRRPEEKDDDYPPTEEIRLESVSEDDFPPTEEIPIDEPKPRVEEKKSATDQLRSLLSKIKKK